MPIKNRLNFLLTCCITLCLWATIQSQETAKNEITNAVKGLELRAIGPAVMGGRIADIAVSTQDPSTWFVAVGSGGLWKTENNGISWKPIFDAEASYSIGTVAIDPNNENVVWVGTGENVSGRHVGWGDGVYKSNDSGRTWNRVGLLKSEHIGKILIDPRNSDVVFVAAEGPLWSAGGERGVYKTMDGGKTWSLVLEIDEHTGVTDIEFDPTNPDIIYAAAYQRRRQVWALLSGGPKSGIYKSTDNGASWVHKTTGLPKGDMGKIGLAVTPADSNLVYATIEANAAEKGFYRSTDKGESWEQRNSYISGGTGPHYYQEIEVSPTNEDLIYQMDVFIHVTRDGGQNFKVLGTGREKHSDNHALWIDPKNGKHLLAGTDGGLYESFDQGTTWRHFPNLPIAQFYKLSLDNSEPFYNIVGGAQDLGTLFGPSRTMNTEGVRNGDWYVPLGADGYDNAFDPNDPNIIYMEIQEGNLNRYDRRSQEATDIQPQPRPGEMPERWNWDSPLLISPHNGNRLYYGSQRLWRSNDRGNFWEPISTDLTTNRNRYELDIIGKVWSVDALYDNSAMSKYATLTAIAESPIVEGVLYVGSDDGLLHVSEDGGENWKRMTAMPKVPALSFINDIEASSHDGSTLFVSADAHKFGDFNPYLFMSTDRGRSWKSIAGNLPKETIVWAIKQDPKDSNLIFLGTEYGIYFSVDKGAQWIPLKSGVPTIPFRDIELHHRDNDLVGASFGRGFYVLDDYTPLREISSVVKTGTTALFPVRDAWWYVPNTPMQAKGMPTLGTTSFAAENPPFGALFTYYTSDIPKTSKAIRQQEEETLRDKKMSIPFPGWEQLASEATEEDARILLLVSDGNGKPVRWLEGPAEKGLHRINWDLRLSPPDPIDLTVPEFKPPWAGDDQGPLAAPGTYTAQLYTFFEGRLEIQGASQDFVVKPVFKSNDSTEVAQFQKMTAELSRKVSTAAKKLVEVNERLRYINAALVKTPEGPQRLLARLEELKRKLNGLKNTLNGDSVKLAKDESVSPSIRSRVGQVAYAHWETTQPATQTQKLNIEIAKADFEKFQQEFRNYLMELEAFEADLEKVGAPYTPSRKL